MSEIEVKIRDDKAMLYTPYNPEFVKRIKKFSDARWNSGEKCWTIDESNLDAARVIMKEIYAKNWESVVNEDSEILLHNVNKNLYEEYLENPQEEYEIEVVTDSIDSAALKQEKERLLKRIKEIDHVLNCEG